MLATIANFALITPFHSAAQSADDSELSLELLQYLAEFSDTNGELIDPETMQPLAEAVQCQPVQTATKPLQAVKKVSAPKVTKVNKAGGTTPSQNSGECVPLKSTKPSEKTNPVPAQKQESSEPSNQENSL